LKKRRKKEKGLTMEKKKGNICVGTAGVAGDRGASTGKIPLDKGLGTCLSRKKKREKIVAVGEVTKGRTRQSPD